MVKALRCQFEAIPEALRNYDEADIRLVLSDIRDLEKAVARILEEREAARARVHRLPLPTNDGGAA